MIQQFIGKREEEGKGETEFVWIQSNMGRNGLLNESHTEQDRKAARGIK